MYTPGGERAKRGRLDTVGGPAGVPKVVADTDAEPAEVGPDNGNGGALTALDAHAAALAFVLRLPLATFNTDMKANLGEKMFLCHFS